MIIDKPLITHIILVVTIIGGVNIIPFAIVTGRYFDKLLELRKLPKPPNDGILPYGVMNRVSTYMIYIMYDEVRVSKSGKFRDPYLEKIKDFKFRAHARPIDYIFIFIELIGVVAFIGLLILIFW